ncbi:shikimate dehydrogenase family protein [Flavihumibacter petaseus]|uniref:Shikimate dehydrogenase n=1 Tax=Flavihumibacter petaseus NBRC 106054 TaxID=1220578 RepID=A0A0E9N3D5_9BACT|nr:shikimate dehydrogenase [Flavihumibacter petaseus]GAO44186.1 shikimate dehydrogenase [Flavihumibacter petaseus NBRC 106054]
MRHFGLIGYPLGHSFSKGFFTEKFQREGIAAVYENYPLESITELPALLQNNPGIEGLNVTIPYKEQVIPYLDEVSPVVQEIGACNCIRIVNGKLIGHNTDVTGFEKSFSRKLKPGHYPALVLGTGGASKAVQYVLRLLGIPFSVVSRNANPGQGILSYEGLSHELQAESLVWINTTPLGMKPDLGTRPPMQYSMLSRDHYLYDLVYNPPCTRFLSEGLERGAVIENGHDMLEIQALESWKIWNR